jgi:hypothetical protein
MSPLDTNCRPGTTATGSVYSTTSPVAMSQIANRTLVGAAGLISASRLVKKTLRDVVMWTLMPRSQPVSATASGWGAVSSSCAWATPPDNITRPTTAARTERDGFT